MGTPLIVASPSHPAEVTARNFLRASIFCTTPHHFFFCFSLFGSQMLKTRSFKIIYIYRESLKVTLHAQRKAHKGPKKTLSLHLKLIFSTEMAYNNQKKIFFKSKKQQTLGKRVNLISRAITLKKHKTYKDTRKYVPFKGKK